MSKSDDLISRAEAVKAICGDCDWYNTASCEGEEWECDSVNKLRSLPSAEAENRNYIKIYADDEPSVKAEKLYQICDEIQNREVAEWLKEYFPSAEAKTKCIAQIKVDTEELARRIKEEYDITDGWIPCSERLPEEDGRYQVTRYDDVTNTEFIDILWYEKNLWWNRHSTGDYAVTAWLPLQKPWKGEDNEND